MFASIGSISTGTLRAQDLAQAYCHALRHLARRGLNKTLDDSALHACDHVSKLLSEGDEQGLEEFVNEQAPNLFTGYCAPFTYFGAHPGDGADIGIWPDVDSLEYAARMHDGVVKVDAGDPWPPLAEDIDYVVEVNDHGNVTLFDARTRKPLWDCV